MPVAFHVAAPYNMDEFFSYHALFCWYYPGNLLNDFLEKCGNYDMRLAWTSWILPLRSGDYIGSVLGLFYLPIFLWWRSPISARMLGMIFLLAQAVLGAKVLKIRPVYAVLGVVLYFPYAFQHLVDTGPLGFHAMSVFLFLFLFDRWFQRPLFRYPLLGAVVFAVAFWMKLVIFWLVPGIAALFVLAAYEHRSHWLRRDRWTSYAWQLLAAALIAISLMSVYAFSSNTGDPWDFPIIRQLQNDEMRSMSDLFHRFWQLDVTKKLLHPLESTHRIFSVDPPSLLSWLYTAVTFLSIPLLLVILSFVERKRFRIVRAAVFYVAFIVTFLIIAKTNRAQHMHHAVLALPFFVLSAMETFAVIAAGSARKKTTVILQNIGCCLIGMLATLNAYWYARFPLQPVLDHDDPSKMRINRLLHRDDLAREYLYVTVDWGMYYYQSLYGSREQAVLFTRDPHGDHDRLIQLSRQTRRKLLFLYIDHDGRATNVLTEAFPVRRCDVIEPESVWEVVAEDGSAFRKACGIAE